MPSWDAPDEHRFKASTYSAAGGSVEVGWVPGDEREIVVRNSHARDLPGLVFTPREWEAFVRGAKAGEFDIPTAR